MRTAHQALADRPSLLDCSNYTQILRGCYVMPGTQSDHLNLSAVQVASYGIQQNHPAGQQL
jgi:hypothetical protein